MDEQQQTTEVRNTETQEGDTNVQHQKVTTATNTDGRTVAEQIVWYIAGFIIVLLALRVLLLMLGANQGNWFVDFIYSVSAIFAAPFAGIFAAPTYGQFFFDTASVVAIAIYALLAWGIQKLVTIGSAHQD
ncbi:YggT family protein [Candidatus Saccharibacteria bacterium]|nr:YggT family protein [Candidatus Saccharibacteria bacterium]